MLAERGCVHPHDEKATPGLDGVLPTWVGERGLCRANRLPSSPTKTPSQGALPREVIRDGVSMLPGRLASSPEGERGKKGPNLAGSHTRVARYVTWKPVGRPALPACAHRSAHAQNLSSPLGPATFFPTGVAFPAALQTQPPQEN